METIVWTEDLSVGVAKFDNEHKELVDFLNRLNMSLQIGSTQKAMGEILTGLVKYTSIHFKHEEYYMVLYDYPEFAVHKQEHDILTAQVMDFYDRFVNNNAPFSIELLTFLRDWIINHIQKMDMMYKEFFIKKLS